MLSDMKGSRVARTIFQGTSDTVSILQPSEDATAAKSVEKNAVPNNSTLLTSV